MSNEKLLINNPKSNNSEVMSNKQIEEMARFMCGDCADYGTCKYDVCEGNIDVATDLYNAGYRKQSEGEWKDQYNGKYANPIYVCSLCGKGTLLTPYINELHNMEMTQALSPFCPNCGAKMKGGAEQSCNDCASQDGCEKATHHENYRITGCMDFKSMEEQNE